MNSDPFSVLGLDPDASAAEVRAARRRLAKGLHPDAGGEVARMQRLNTATAEALASIRRRTEGDATSEDERKSESETTPSEDTQWGPMGFDVPSFTIEALPAEAFHALVLAGERFARVLDEDPPYRLDVEMTDPQHIWCRLEIVPDAGASTVSLAASIAADALIPIEAVRDRWVSALNALDWSRVSGDA